MAKTKAKAKKQKPTTTTTAPPPPPPIKSEHAWVYPWDQSKWLGSVDTRDYIMYQLNRLDYPMEEMSREVPALRLQKAMHKVLDLLALLYNTEESRPWILLVSNDQATLSGLGQLVPPIWALTDHKSVRTITTPLLVDLMRSSRPQDDWQDDPHGEQVYEIGRAQFLWWNFIDRHVPGAPKLEGRFGEVLQGKIDDPEQVLVVTYTADIEEVNAEVEDEIFDRIRANLGDAVGQAVRHYARRFFLKMKSPGDEPWVAEEVE